LGSVGTAGPCRLWRRALLRALKGGWLVWLFLIWEGRIGIARDMGSGVQDNNFTMTGAEKSGGGDDINRSAELIDPLLG